MALSLRETLSKSAAGIVQPNGDGSPVLLAWQEIGTYLRERYIKNDEEKKRMEKAAQRQRFYQCRGDAEMFDMLQGVYDNDTVIELRRRFVEFAKYNNITRRVTETLATVYSSPASRTVEGDENNAKYQEVQRLSRQHEVMQRVDKMSFLHRCVAVGPRMRQRPDDVWVPTIDVVTPAKFHAVRDPLDPTMLVALIFELDYALASSMKVGPKWLVVGWRETLTIGEDGILMEQSIRDHGFPSIPWVLMTLEPPDGALLDQTTGDDLTAAQKMIWFLNILHAKESKSTTVQIIAQGDISHTAREQVNDSDATGHVQEGVQITSVNRSVDTTVFTKGAQHVGETTGSNFGIPPHVMRGDSVASAAARDLDRAPLRELRLQRHIPFREFERDFAEVQSFVVAAKRPDLAFGTKGWGINFADPQTPLSPKEALELFEHKRKLLRTSTVADMVSEDPDLSPEKAKEVIEQFAEDEIWRNKVMRPLQQMSGSAGAEMPDGNESNPGKEMAARAMADDETEDETEDAMSWVEEFMDAA